MTATRLLRHAAVSALAAGPAGGFLVGTLHAGDPDPNPIGRLVHACLLAVLTPLKGGFPPHHAAGEGVFFNAWPHILAACLLVFAWLVWRDLVRSRGA